MPALGEGGKGGLEDVEALRTAEGFQAGNAWVGTLEHDDEDPNTALLVSGCCRRVMRRNQVSSRLMISHQRWQGGRE